MRFILKPKVLVAVQKGGDPLASCHLAGWLGWLAGLAATWLAALAATWPAIRLGFHGVFINLFAIDNNKGISPPSHNMGLTFHTIKFNKALPSLDN